MYELKHLLFEQLQNNEFFKGGFILTILAGLGIWLKSLIPMIKERFRRLFCYEMKIESKTELYSIFNNWLLQNYNQKYKKVLASTDENLAKHEEDRYRLIETNYESSFHFWYKRQLIFVTSSREKLEASNIFIHAHIESYTLTVYFNKLILKSLIENVVEKYNSGRKEKQYSYLFDYTYEWNKTINLNSKSFDKIFNSEKHLLLNDIVTFLDRKEFYTHTGTPFRRGYLLYGPPGNSKTSTVLAIAQKLMKDVYCLNVASLNSDHDLKRAFRQIKDNSFLLLEDIDCVVNNREKIADHINFSTLLNCLDGVHSKEAVCIFFTTNHPEKLDEALTRCGRIDKKIEFVNPKVSDVENLLHLFFDEVQNVREYQENYSGAELQEICLKSNNISEALVVLESKEKVKM